MVIYYRKKCLRSPVWGERSALQTLHKISSKAREQNYFEGGQSHEWVSYYDKKIESDRSCLNEWHAMDNLESRRPPSPNSIRTKPTEREEAEMIIRSTLKEIMMSVDLDEVTSKCIRNRLEEDLNMNLNEFKSFIDQEIITILGQMDAPTEIFEHVYLGSEWNASNFEELQKNGVGHILNVTREIDNFFPGMFDYLNVRVLDDEKTDLLKHWDNTFKYITKARNKGSKVLVHCKMGVSRSASVVIAYAMKAYNWDFSTALKHVKEKRNCIKPNKSFITQLETYQGILDAMKNKDKLLRSKSETNLKNETSKADKKEIENNRNFRRESKSIIKHVSTRSKSWSPDCRLKDLENPIPIFLSLENINQPQKRRKYPSNFIENARNVLMPLNNGQSYSVSPNQIVHIPGTSKKVTKIKKIVLNLTSHFNKIEPSSSFNELKISTAQLNFQTWDPGEKDKDTITKDKDIIWTSNVHLKQQGVPKNEPEEPKIEAINKTLIEKVEPKCEVQKEVKKTEEKKGDGVVKLGRKEGDPFSNRVDKVFDREERRSKSDEERKCPSRQSSWSSYDSAVVLGYQGESREAPSRHSSWGSGDTRTLPSRNSSWGSYDTRRSHISQTITEKDPKESKEDKDILSTSSSGIFAYDKDEIPWYPGTVKRTKQKLEGSEVKNVLVETLPIDVSPKAPQRKVIHYQSSPALCSKKMEKTELSETSRLSVSAPGSSNLSVFSIEENQSGLVKNLKKEFEKSKKSDRKESDKTPSSPKICENEDISVKELVGKYENESPILRQKCNNYNKNNRYSCIEVLSSQNDDAKSERPKSAFFPPNVPAQQNTHQNTPKTNLKLQLNNPNGQLLNAKIPSSPLKRNPLSPNSKVPVLPLKSLKYPLSSPKKVNSSEKDSLITTLSPILNNKDQVGLNSSVPLSSFVKSSVVKAAAAKKQLRNRDFSNYNNVKLKNNSHNTM